MAMLQKRRRVIGYQSHFGSDSINLYRCEDCQCYFPTIKSVTEHFKSYDDSLNDLTCKYRSILAERFDEQTVKALKSTSEPVDICRGSTRKSDCRINRKVFGDNISNQISNKHAESFFKRKHDYLSNNPDEVLSNYSPDTKETIDISSESCSDDDIEEIGLTSETIDELFTNENNDIDKEVYNSTGHKDVEEPRCNTLIDSHSVKANHYLSQDVQNINDSLINKPSTLILTDESESICKVLPSNILEESKFYQNSSGISHLAGRESVIKNVQLDRDNQILKDNLIDKYDTLQRENTKTHAENKVTNPCKSDESTVHSSLIIASNCSSIEDIVSKTKVKSPVNEKHVDNVISFTNERLNSSNSLLYIKNEESGECIASIDISSVTDENKAQRDKEINISNERGENILTINALHRHGKLNESTLEKNNTSLSKTTVTKPSHEIANHEKNTISKSLPGKNGSISWQTEHFRISNGIPLRCEGNDIVGSAVKTSIHFGQGHANKQRNEDANDGNKGKECILKSNMVEKDNINIEGNNDKEVVRINNETRTDILNNHIHEDSKSDGTVNTCPTDSVVYIKCEVTGNCIASIDMPTYVSDEIMDSQNDANQNKARIGNINKSVMTIGSKDWLEVNVQKESHSVDVSLKNCSRVMKVSQLSEEITQNKNERKESNSERIDSVRDSRNEELHEDSHALEKTNFISSNRDIGCSFRKREVNIMTRRHPVEVLLKNSPSIMQVCQLSEEITQNSNERIEPNLGSINIVRGNINEDLTEDCNAIDERTKIISSNRGSRYSFRKRALCYYGEDDINENLDDSDNSELSYDSYKNSCPRTNSKENSRENDHKGTAVTLNCRMESTKFEKTSHHLDASSKDLEESNSISCYSSDSNESCHTRSCDQCNTHFNSTNCYINHMILYHHPAFTRKDLTKCPICNLSYDSYFNSKLRLHITKTHSLDEMKCLRCNHRFDASIDLQKHIVVCYENELRTANKMSRDCIAQCLKCKCFHIYKPSDCSQDLIREILQTLPSVSEVNLLREKYDTILKMSCGKGTGNAKFYCFKCKCTFERLSCSVNHIILFHMHDSFVDCPIVYRISNSFNCDICEIEHSVTIKRKYKKSYLKYLRFHDGNNHFASEQDSLTFGDKKFFALVRDGLVKYFGFENMKSNEGSLSCRECNIVIGPFTCGLNHIVKNHFDLANKNIFLQARFIRRARTSSKCCKNQHGFTIFDRPLFNMYLSRAFDQTMDNESLDPQEKELSIRTNVNLKKLSEFLVPINNELSREDTLNVSSVKSRREISKDMVYRIVHINGYFYCQICHSGFKQISCCKTHVLTEHSYFFNYQRGSEVYTCLICKNHYHRLYFLNIHFEQYHNIYKFICTKCDKKFNNCKYDHFKYCKNFVKCNGNEQLVCRDCDNIHNCMVYDTEEALIKSYSTGNETIFNDIRNNQTKFLGVKGASSDKETISKVSNIEDFNNFEEDPVKHSESDREKSSSSHIKEGSKCDEEIYSISKQIQVSKPYIESFLSSDSIPDKEDYSRFGLGGKKADGTDYWSSDIEEEANHNAKGKPKSDMTKVDTIEPCKQNDLEPQTVDHLKLNREKSKEHVNGKNFDENRLGNVEPVSRGLSKSCHEDSSEQRNNSDVAFDGKLFFCVICLENFEEFPCCFTHVLLKHYNSNVFTCSICFETRRYRLAHISHLKKMHNLDSCYCGHCWFGFEDINLREKHKINCENPSEKNTDLCSKYVCKECFTVHVKVPDYSKASCTECDLGFASIACAKNHFYMQHFPSWVILSSTYTSFRCHCEKVVFTKAELHLHLLTEHRSTEDTQIREKTCHMETYRGSNDIDYDSYFKSVADKKCVGCDHFHIIYSKEMKVKKCQETKCTVCKIKFSDNFCLKNHKLNKHGYKNEVRQCVGCGLYCAGSAVLERHQKYKPIINQHKTGKNEGDSNGIECQRSVCLLKCDKCGEVHQHKFMLEELKLYEAKSPQTIKEERIVKMKIEKPTCVCPYCDIEVENRRLLADHIKCCHKKITDKKGDFCQVCKKQIESNMYYSEHVKQEHCAFKFVEGELLDDFSAKFSCIYCKETFSFAMDVLMHLRIKHFEKPLVARKHSRSEFNSTSIIGQACVHCPLCFKHYKEIPGSHFNLHFIRLKTHKKFVCDICGKILTSPGRLKDHKYSHTGERRYKCNICEKSFLNISNLQTHELVHKEKKEECKECGMKFTLPHHLRAHMKRKHP